MKKFVIFIAIILILTISLFVIFGCGEKKVEEEVEQTMEQVEEEVPVDTTAVDTSAVEEAVE